MLRGSNGAKALREQSVDRLAYERATVFAAVCECHQYIELRDLILV